MQNVSHPNPDADFPVCRGCIISASVSCGVGFVELGFWEEGGGEVAGMKVEIEGRGVGGRY